MATVLAVELGQAMGVGVPALGPDATCIDVAKGVARGIISHVLAHMPWQPAALLAFHRQASVRVAPTTKAFASSSRNGFDLQSRCYPLIFRC